MIATEHVLNSRTVVNMYFQELRTFEQILTRNVCRQETQKTPETVRKLGCFAVITQIIHLCTNLIDHSTTHRLRPWYLNKFCNSANRIKPKIFNCM